MAFFAPMIVREKFQPDEWQTLCETPFRLLSTLTDGADNTVVNDCLSALKNEIRQLQFFPPFVRVLFISIINDNSLDVLKHETLQTNDLQSTLEFLRHRTSETETAQFQMSLAFIARTILKLHGKTIADSISANKTGKPMPLMANVWGLLKINASSSKNIQVKTWQKLQLGLMNAWLYASLLDGDISAAETNVFQTLRRSSFPPLLWEIIPQTVSNLDAIYKVAVAENKPQLFSLKEIAMFVDENLNVSDAVFYKMSLLVLARDVLEISALNNGVPTFDELSLKAISKISAALNLDKPYLPKDLTNSENAPISILPTIENTAKDYNAMITPENDSPEVQPENVGNLVNVENVDEKPIVETVSNEISQPLENQVSQQVVTETPENIGNVIITETPENIGNVIIDDLPNNNSSSEIPTEIANQLLPPKPLVIEINEAEILSELAGTLPTSLGSFNDYKRTVNLVGADLRDLMETASELKMQNSASLLNEMSKRVEENSFSIAVVGEFKRGKSTFINALLGKDILPSDILPCSATLNRVTYGVKPDVLIRYKDGREDHVEINQLQDYVTKLTEESEETASKVKEAIVSYPIPYCQNNVEIIDTPGLNDDAAMTDVTLGVLPNVDAAVLVIMAQSPFSEYERAFLEDKLLTSDLGRVMFLVTAIDRLNRPEDADRVVKAIKDRIRKYVIKRAAEQFGADSEEYDVYLRKIGEPRVFPVSAWQALQAKEKGDANLLDLSRFNVFENALEKFLSEERGAVFLQVPINRLLSASGEVLSSFKIREGALQMRQSDFTAAHEKTLSEIEALRGRKNVEMQRIDQAARQVELEVKPLVQELDETFKNAAAEILDNAEISNEDVANQAAIAKLVERLNAQIQAAVQTATQKQLEKIQLVVQRGVAAEAMRWTDFSDAMNTMSKTIEGRFGGEGLEIQDTTLTQGVGIVATLFGFGGAYTGYKVAGWKGAGTGAVASLGVGLGTLIAVGLVAGTFLALPILIIGTLAALPAGGWLTRKMFGDESVKKFREQFKTAVLENLEKQLSSQSIEQKIIGEIEKAFDDLKNKIHLEVESTLNDTEKTLDELQAKRGRDEILSETEYQQLAKMKRATVKIRKRAEMLNDLLVNTVSVQ